MVGNCFGQSDHEMIKFKMKSQNHRIGHIGRDHSPTSLLKQGRPRAYGRELFPDYPEYPQ